MNSDATEFWFNMQTGEVEVGKQTLALYRIGPFDDYESAEHALEIIAARAAAWGDEDDEDYSGNDSSAEGKLDD